MVVSITPDGDIDIFNERVCPGCDEEETLSDTGCDAEDCRGYSCIECGWGCDIEVLDEDDEGSCAWRLANEDLEDREERFAAERAVLGMGGLT